jgi:phosphoribosylanthranilate isomerase
MAIRYGADAVGFVSQMPSGAGVISEDLIQAIVPIIPPGVASFLLTSLQDAQSIIAQQRRLRTNTIQMVDRLVSGTYEEIKAALPGVSLVQVIHVLSEESLREAVEVAKYVDGLLLDSGNPRLAVKQLGGTGRTHNWNISKKIVESVDKPVFLAGGLNHTNVADAVDFVRPFGIDVCTGVRSDNRLDETKLRLFLEKIALAEQGSH